jgi:hypothetical protein
MAPWLAPDLTVIANQVQAVERALDEIVENDRQDESLRAQVRAGAVAPNVVPLRPKPATKSPTF